MMIECVPNVSEGRRPGAIAAMADAITRVGGVRLLDHSSDGSHNRSVFTFVGNAASVVEAALALVELAVASIDLRTHRGEHPRIGAVDVIPFVPLRDVTMAACVDVAREVGAAIARRFAIPVYLYEAAATAPARVRLEDVRRGGFEKLAARMATPGWAPDFGPSTPHPTAGATAVGARMPLVAYNINLASNRLDVAKAIAAAIRASSGGLPAVKAIGVALADRGIVQVSMNLTNYHETSLARVFDAVRQRAGEHHVAILESEIIGLVPEDALVGTSWEDLRLSGAAADHILERRLR
ncbi:MAG: glutamate formimidoyltransferase [Acidobacteriota bacterium]